MVFMDLYMETKKLRRYLKQEYLERERERGTRAKLEEPESSRAAISLNIFSSRKQLRIDFTDNLVVSVHLPCFLGGQVQWHLSFHAPHFSVSMWPPGFWLSAYLC